LGRDDDLPVTWRYYLWVSLKFLVIFYIATLCLGLLFLHRGEHWQLPGMVIGVLYLFIIIFSAVRLVRKLSMAAVMVASPTLPLCMLLIVVSLLPTLQSIDQREHISQNQPGHVSKQK
jgi:hypothetical protein